MALISNPVLFHNLKYLCTRLHLNTQESEGISGQNMSVKKNIQ